MHTGKRETHGNGSFAEFLRGSAYMLVPIAGAQVEVHMGAGT
jgi:hypothetical protein